MLRWFPNDELFPIVDLKSACRGIDIIVDQGEGTSSDPFQSPGDPAHYYKFGEILHGRTIVKTDTGYAYAGAPIPFNPAGVHPMKPNPKIADFEPGSQAHTRVSEFAYAYSSLLNALHQAFNGAPDRDRCGDRAHVRVEDDRGSASCRRRSATAVRRPPAELRVRRHGKLTNGPAESSASSASSASPRARSQRFPNGRGRGEGNLIDPIVRPRPRRPVP